MISLPDGTMEVLEPLVARFEGRENNAYRDERGIWTIGIGSTTGVKPGMVISDAEIDSRFAADISTAVAGFLAHLDPQVALNKNQCAALISLIFNIGVHAWATSTLLGDVNRGLYGQVAYQIEQWDHVNGKVSNGLKTRREAEAALFETPVQETTVTAPEESVPVITTPPSFWRRVRAWFA